MTSKRVHELAIFDDFVVDGAVVKEEEIMMLVRE